MDQNPTQTPFFSVGITTYNRPDLLVQSVRSLLNQEFTDFEILVGNDYVEEHLTKEIFGTDDDRIIIVNNRENLGELANMNSLLNLARGRYFAWQFDDDLCAPGYLSESYKALKTHDFPDCVFSSFEYIYGDSGVSLPGKVKNIRVFPGREFLRSYLSGKIRVLGSAGFIRTDLVKSFGGAVRLTEGKMAVYSEYLIIFKSALSGKIIYLDSKLTGYRVHENSWSCNPAEVILFRQAGLNLLRESLPVFAHESLKEDFRVNLTALLKSIISVVVTKCRMAGVRGSSAMIREYISELKDQLNLVEDPDLYKISVQCLKESSSYLPLFRLKSYMRSSVSLSNLKFAHKLKTALSDYIKKPF